MAKEPTTVDEVKPQRDLDSSRLYNESRFSDVLIKFSGREIKAHRFVLCDKSAYFDKLCGPDSSFAEAKQIEIILHDDIPEALEALLRHLYNFVLKAPSSNLDVSEKVNYYCNIVVVADKYNVPELAKKQTKASTSL